MNEKEVEGNKDDVSNPKDDIKNEEEEKKVYDFDWFVGKREGIQYFPWKIYLLLFGNWLVQAIFDVIVGTASIGIVCGTALYWGLISLTIPLYIVLAIGIAFFLHNLYLRRQEEGYEYTVSDLKWTWKRIFLFQGLSLITGVLAAMFGLGGGTLNSPTLLELGLIPAQVPATSGLLILITSSVAIIQYLSLGKINVQYLVWFIFIGFIGGITGHLGIRYYIKKYRKQSLIVFLLGFMVFAGLVVLIYTISILFVSKTAVMSIASPCAS